MEKIASKCLDKMEKNCKRSKPFSWTEELIDKLIDLRYEKVKKLKEIGGELSAKNLWLDVPQSLGLPKQVTPDKTCRKWNQLMKKYKAIQLKLQTGTCSHEEKAWPYSDRISDILEEQWTFENPPQDSEFDILQMAWEERSSKAKSSNNLRSVVWEHFVRLNKKFAQCKHCNKKLSFGTTISNLRKHLRIKHSRIRVSMDYSEEMETTSEKIESFIDQNDDRIADPDYQPEKEKSDILELACIEIDATTTRNNNCRSAIWKSFVRIDDSYVQCRLCKKTFRYYSSISNLKQHLRKEHPTMGKRIAISSEEVEDACKNIEKENSENSIEKKEARAPEIIKLTSSGINSKNLGLLRSTLWEHFDKIDKKFAQCKLCERRLSHYSTITNLKKHLLSKHPSVKSDLDYTEDMEVNSKTIEDDADSFPEDSDPQPEKEKSGHPEIIKLSSSGTNSTNLGRKRSSVWEHFDMIDKKSAQCKRCKKRLSYGSTISNLRRHLITKHPIDDSSENPEDLEVKSCTSEDGPENFTEDSNPEPKKKISGHPEIIKLSSSVGTNSMDLGSPNRSTIWAHFDKIGRKFAQCRHCEKRLSYFSTVTNLRKHLRSIHPKMHANLTHPEDMGVKSNLNEDGAEDSNPEPTEENTGETLQRNETNMSNRSSYVWKYFKILDKYYAQCNACKDTLSYKSTIYNLVKHRQKVHPTLKTLKPPSNKKSKRGADEGASSESGDSSHSFDVASDTNENEDNLLDNNQDKTGLTKEFTDALRAIKAKKSSGLKESYLWNFFSVVDENFAECNMCHEKLVYKKGLGDLAMHQRLKHPLLNKGKTSRKEMFKNETGPPYEDLYPRIQITDIHGAESLEDMQNRNRKYSFVWNFFTDLGDRTAECHVCRKRLSYKTTSTNLMKHRKYKHPELPTFIIVDRNGEKVVENLYGKRNPSRRPKISKLWQFFKYLNDEYALCKMCNKKLSHKYTTANLMTHKNRVHPDVRLDHFSPPEPTESNETPKITPNEEPNDYDDHNNADNGPDSINDNSDDETQPVLKFLKKKHETSPIWRLFDRIDHTFAKCKFCNHFLSHRSTNTNLLKHVKKKHPEVFKQFTAMKNKVNTLVDQFFPVNSDTTLTATNDVTTSIAAESSVPQEIQIFIDGNQQSFDYNNVSAYTLPVIYIQDEQNPNNMKMVTTGGDVFTSTASHNAGENTATIIMDIDTGSTTTQQNSEAIQLLSNVASDVQVQTVHPTEHVSFTSRNASTASRNVSTEQVPSTSFNSSENPVRVSTPSNDASANSTHVPSATTQRNSDAIQLLNNVANNVQVSVPGNTLQVHVAHSGTNGEPVRSPSIDTARLPTTVLNINGNAIQIPTHLLSGNTAQVPTHLLSGNTAQVPTNILSMRGNTSQVPANVLNASGGNSATSNVQIVGGNAARVAAASFDANGNGVASANDYLLSRLEENNKLMQEMQRTIDRQNDVLLRLAESIGDRRERSREEMLTD